MNFALRLHRASLGLALSIPAASQGPTAPSCFSIVQSSGFDNFGSRSTGQTFTPGIGLAPSAGSNQALPLTEITLYQGNSGATAPSATTYLNIYDGDPGAGGSFVGSSINSIDTNNPTFFTPMTWRFNFVVLSTMTEYWAIMSSTDVAGSLDVAVSLETERRNGPPGPDIYTGGAGLIANIVPHPNSVDARFEIVFSFAPPSTFRTFGVGCAGSGGTPTVSAAPGSTPRLGQSYTVDCTNLPPSATTAFAALGFSRLTPAVDLTAIGMVGCNLYINLNITTSQAVSGGSASFTVNVPQDQIWAGATLLHQWIVVDPGANGLGLIVSNAGEAIVGC